jgi:hypothetical protein
MGLFHSLFYHCPEAVHNVVKAEEGHLGPVDRLRLKVHLAVCKACAVFAEQSALIRKALPDALKNTAGARLSDAEKRQLEEQLK